MRRPVLCLFLIILSLLVIASSAWAQPEKESEFQGKSLSEWAQQFKTAKEFKAREDAVIALGEIGIKDSSAIPFVIQALDDESLKVRARALQALAMIGTPAKAAVPKLEELLKKYRFKKSRSDVLFALERVQGVVTDWTMKRMIHFGLQLKKPSAELAAHLELSRDYGLLISRLEPDSPAAKAGLKAFDVLLEINGKEVPNHLPGLLKLLEKIKPKEPFTALVMRKGVLTTVKEIQFPNFLPQQEVKAPPTNEKYVIEVEKSTFTGIWRGGEDKVQVEGTFVEGKPSVTSVSILIGDVNETYKGMSEMPQKYKRFALKLIPRPQPPK